MQLISEKKLSVVEMFKVVFTLDKKKHFKKVVLLTYYFANLLIKVTGSNFVGYFKSFSKWELLFSKNTDLSKNTKNFDQLYSFLSTFLNRSEDREKQSIFVVVKLDNNHNPYTFCRMKKYFHYYSQSYLAFTYEKRYNYIFCVILNHNYYENECKSNHPEMFSYFYSM